MRFAIQPSSTPHVAVAHTDGRAQLFVRFAVPLRGDLVAIASHLEAEVELALKAARSQERPIERVVVVGTDALFAGTSAACGDPALAEGYVPAVGALGQLFAALARSGVPFVWRTRGGLSRPLPPVVGAALAEAGVLASLELGLPCLDSALCRALEGGQGASPEERLKLAAAVSGRGVAVRGLIDPLVPMLTDQRASLEPLLGALAEAGAHRVAIRYLVLTRDKAKGLARRLTSMHRALIQGCFAEQPWRPARADSPAAYEHTAHKRLPRALREKGHARVVDAAARVGVVVDVLDPPGADEDTPLSAPPERPSRGRRQAGARRPQLDLFRARR